MNKNTAQAQVFMTVFKAMPKKIREKFFVNLAMDKSLLNDLNDIALAESRKNEKERPFRDFIKEKGL